MIICVCRRINEKAVREAVREGARCPESVQAHHGQSFNCGKCRCAMGEVIGDEMARQPQTALPMAAE